MGSDSSFWRTYHSLLNWVDGDGLPDPDKLDAAHWMLELREACKQGAIDSSKAFKMCCAGLDATEKRTKVFPLTVDDPLQGASIYNRMTCPMCGSDLVPTAGPLSNIWKCPRCEGKEVSRAQ